MPVHPDDPRGSGDLHDPADLHPDTPDTAALRRRVLLTGVLTLAAWIGVVVLLDALRLGPFFAVLAAAILYLLVIRPLMRPVRDAVKLRRRLAYQAWLDGRDETGGGERG
jgi:hypothetical protein